MARAREEYQQNSRNVIQGENRDSPLENHYREMIQLGNDHIQVHK
ncbi:MAG: hypothetical protein V4471_01525 [Pseudomonadota bacterium]